MTAAELEHEYNNRLRVPGAAGFFAAWDARSRAYRKERAANGLAELDRPYGPSPRQILSLFRPEADETGPVCVFIHGGYWQLFEQERFGHLARGANAHGLTMAVVGYDLCPAVTLAEVIDQIRRACLFLWRLFGRRLVLSGHSAGGHLTACMLATDWRDHGLESGDLVPAGLAISGVFDLAPLLATSINEKLGLDGETARRLSPLHWPVPAGRAIEAAVGSAESAAFRSQSRRLVDTWSRNGASASYREIEGAHHFDVIDPLADPDSPLTARLVSLARAVAT